MKVRIQNNYHHIPGTIKIPPKPNAEGKTAYIFFTADDQFAVKIYKNPAVDDRKRLETVLSLTKNLGDDGNYGVWPLALVTEINNKPCTGIISRKVPHKKLDNFAFAPYFALQQFKQGYTWLNFLKIARSIAIATRSIHDRGAAHGDISLNNILGDMKMGEARMIDLDGIVVKGFLPPQVLGTPGFIAPELYNELTEQRVAAREGKFYRRQLDPSIDSDKHSLAVIILWVLLFRNVMQPVVCYDEEDPVLDDALGYGKFACFSEHPRDKRNYFPRIGASFLTGGFPSYRNLTPHLQYLTEQALIDGLHNPNKRPPAREWERALAEAYDVLYRCRKCKQSILYPYWVEPALRICPFCNARIAPPYPVVLQLLEGNRGQFMTVRSFGQNKATPLIWDNGTSVFADIAQKGAIPPFVRRGTPLVGRVAWDANQSAYLLRNESSSAWKVIAGGYSEILPGQTIALKRGVIFSFGDGKRLAKVLE